MSPFFSFSSSVLFSIRLSVLLSLVILSGVPSPASAQVTHIYSGAVQSTRDPTPPCIALGYNVDAVLNVSVPTNNLSRVMRIDRNPSNPRVGYIVSINSITHSWVVTVFDGVSMATLAQREINPTFANNYNDGQYGAEVVDGVLYLVRVVNYLSLGCVSIVNETCLSLSKIDGSATLLSQTVVTPGGRSIDDVRMNGASTLLVSYNYRDTGRRLMTFSIPGSSFITDSGTIGPQAPSQLALNADGGFQFVGYNDATFQLKQIQNDSVTVSINGNFAYPAGNTLGALFVIPEANLLIGEGANAGFPATRNYQNYTTVTNLGNTATFLPSDGGALRRSTYWDRVNGVVHGFWSGPNLMRTNAFPGTVQERFSCVNCGATSDPANDWSESSGRLYVASTPLAGQATVTRIKVCSIGGPPA